jgi:prolyl 4-hydroxylase
MMKQLTQPAEKIWLIQNFWSATRCQAFIEWAESTGFEDAKINIGHGKQAMNKAVRNNERIILDDEELAEHLWKELQPYAPAETEFGVAVGLNERFRLYKYVPGMRFKGHQDGSFLRNINEWSSFTFMIYLNVVKKGGETNFDKCTIVPKTGEALIFAHELWHEGTEVLEGVKYVLRTDVMYKRKGR